MKNLEKQRVRGQRRKGNLLVKRIQEILPFRDTSGLYEHFHVPCGPFIQHPKTSGRIKTAFAEAWLKKTEEILRAKPGELPFCKVTAIIKEPYFWESQIIVFYDREYYEGFWERNREDQVWNHSNVEGSFLKQRNLSVMLPEKAIQEVIYDEECIKKSTLWIYGEFPE